MLLTEDNKMLAKWLHQFSLMFYYYQRSGITLLHFLDWKSKPKWLEEGDSSSCKWIHAKDRTSPAPDFTTSSTDCPNPKGLVEREAH